MASDKTELFKKLPTLNPAMLDNFLFNKGFCIPNQDYNRGKYSFGTQNLLVIYNQFKGSQVGVSSNFATKAHEDLSVQTLYVTEKLKMVNIAFFMSSLI